MTDSRRVDLADWQKQAIDRKFLDIENRLYRDSLEGRDSEGIDMALTHLWRRIHDLEARVAELEG